jgi:hypothetical protein
MRLRVARATVKVNPRHKAALVLTLLATGASLIVGLETKQVVGIALLGLAFAWLLGSNSLLVHSLFIVAGLSLATGRVLWDWQKYRAEARNYRASVAYFESRIPELATQYPEPVGLGPVGGEDAVVVTKDFVPKYEMDAFHLAAAKQAGVKLYRFIPLPGSDLPYLAISLITPKEKVSDRLSKDYPTLSKWECDALAAGVDVWSVHDETPGAEPDLFTLRRAVALNWILVTCGSLLTLVGVGTMFGIRLRSSLSGRALDKASRT